jgi:hypothetical protein
VLLSLSGSGGSEEEVACGKGEGEREYLHKFTLAFVCKLCIGYNKSAATTRSRGRE